MCKLRGVTDPNPVFIDLHSGGVQCRVDLACSLFNCLLRVGVGAEQDVVPAPLENAADHGFDLSAAVNNITSCGGRRYIPSLQLKLTEPTWKEFGSIRPVLPLDTSVLTTVGSRDIVGHMDSILRQVVRLRFDGQQPPEYLRE